jgi:hypothetical protein
MLKPKLPLPVPLKGEDKGSFAENTVVKRLPEIAKRVIAENDFSTDIRSGLEKLITEIPESRIRHLKDDGAPDSDDWRIYVDSHADKDWLRIPWFFAENYFYRRILETTGYFRNDVRLDPFAYQKLVGLQATKELIERLVNRVCETVPGNEKSEESVVFLLTASLWGNQHDLSLWPADTQEQPDHLNDGNISQFVLCDDSASATQYLLKRNGKPARIDFIGDNAGFELVCDLFLIDYLLTSKTASELHLHLKYHPTFVSDAMIVDVMNTLHFLTASEDTDVNRLGGRLLSEIKSGRLILREHLFWTSPEPFWELPVSLLDELRKTELLITKGDANYRRLLGDLH